MPKQTPSQTVGPFFAYGLTPEAYGRAGVAGNNLLTDSTQGERIRIEGVVYDGDGAPVSDAMLEIWQMQKAGSASIRSNPGLYRAGATASRHRMSA